MYIIKYTDIDKPSIFINNEELNTSILDITLIGKATMEYGEEFDENVLHVLENFASEEDPNNPGNPDPTQTLLELLERPTEGELWYNKTTKILYVWNGVKWKELANKSNFAANSGIIAHGQQIPLPVSEDGYVFTYPECSWFVSPQYWDSTVNYIECYTDSNGTVYARYRPLGQSALINGLANYVILGTKGTTNHGIPFPLPSLPVAPSPTPTPTLSPSITPTGTPVAGASPTPTRTVTPTPTPSATVTMTPTLTTTPTITPSVTPTPSGTPAVVDAFVLTAGFFTMNGQDIDSNYGYSQAKSAGTLSPLVYKGNVVITILSQVFGNTFTFVVAMDGLPAANIFNSIRFVDRNGNFKTYNSSDATTNTNGTTRYWIWTETGVVFNANTNYILQIYS
jgi:hypothetical protein